MSTGYYEIEQDRAFLEGREFRVSYPLSIPAGVPVVLKFVAITDFDLTLQTLTCDTESILFEAFRSTQGSESGTFTNDVPIYRNNGKTTTLPSITPKTSITTGGDFTPDVGQTSVETIRLRTSGATAQASTVGEEIQGKRGLPPGTYYLKFSVLSGSSTAAGVYTLKFEEY